MCLKFNVFKRKTTRGIFLILLVNFLKNQELAVPIGATGYFVNRLFFLQIFNEILKFRFLLSRQRDRYPFFPTLVTLLLASYYGLPPITSMKHLFYTLLFFAGEKYFWLASALLVFHTLPNALRSNI